jgi:hypothetical protein
VSIGGVLQSTVVACATNVVLNAFAFLSLKLCRDWKSVLKTRLDVNCCATVQNVVLPCASAFYKLACACPKIVVDTITSPTQARYSASGSEGPYGEYRFCRSPPDYKTSHRGGLPALHYLASSLLSEPQPSQTEKPICTCTAQDV